ncbi:MAG: Sir2 family NAD-dependent protein deacetylase [Planctomycetaceae bacterium]
MTLRLNDDDIVEAAELISRWLAEARSTVAFSGAGISTESGIPDFRSPGGVWSRHRTVYFDEFCHSAEARYEYWQQKAEAHRDFAAAVPNITHQTLAAWESAQKLRGIVTQNIDGLHQQAGSRNVLELHGTARRIACLDCAWQEAADSWVQRFLAEDRVPDCPDCGGRLKHATVSFGQSLPADVLQAAARWAREADLFLTLGSSLVVEPAASLPRIAKQSGAHLVILNRDETPLDSIADLVVNAPLGAVFQAISNLCQD